MFRLGLLVLIATVLQISSAQPELPPTIPPHCRGPPPNVDNPRQCCNIPSIFADEDLEACGIPKTADENFSGAPECIKQKCILGKYKMLKDEDIDFDAVSDYLDKWVEKNPDFKSAVQTAKSRCLGNLPGPPEICAADKMVFCMGSVMFVECPSWQDSDNCKKLKDYIESCRAAIPKS